MKHVFLTYIVEVSSTIKDVLINKLNVSSRLLRKLKLNKRIFCNNKEAWVNDIVEIGDIVSVDISFEENNDKIKPQKCNLDILYEDECILAINKPAGVVVHPTCLHIDGTLANYVKGYLEEKGGNVTTRFVSRLDRETSGVIIFAKNEYTQEILTKEMQSGEFKKEYIAVTYGVIEKDKDTIDLPIKREEGSIMTRTVADDGERAVTHYEVIKRLEDRSVIRLRLETGRTHQIRVHMKAIGHPLVGDGLYSEIKSDLISRQALHASKVSFIHPVKNEVIEITADVPEDMSRLFFRGDIGHLDRYSLTI